MSPNWSGGRNSLASKNRSVDKSELEGLTSTSTDTIELSESGNAEIEPELREMMGADQ